MHGEDRLNIKTQLIIGALKLAESPDHISIDYDVCVQYSWTPELGFNVAFFLTGSIDIGSIVYTNVFILFLFLLQVY